MGEHKGWEVFIDPIELVFCITKEWNSIASYYPLNPATCSLVFFFFFSLVLLREDEKRFESVNSRKKRTEREDVRFRVEGWEFSRTRTWIGSFGRRIHFHYWWNQMAEDFQEGLLVSCVRLSCNINWHCSCCSSEKPSVQNSYFSLHHDLFTATLNWTVIRLLQVGSVDSALTCFWKWTDSLRRNIHHRKKDCELNRRISSLADKQWIN